MANTIQNQVATTAAGEKKSMQSYIKSMEGEIKKALPSVITPERFTRMVLSALSTNPKLAVCTPKSFLGAMMAAAQLGLEPNTPLGQAYLIPYKNKGVDEVQFQLGYKGLIDLAYRSGEVELVQAHVVYANDTFECEYGLEPKLVHKPADKDRGEPIKVYAMFKTKSGGYGFEVMSMDDVRRHAEKYSQAYKTGFSPWKTNFEEMAKKTVERKTGARGIRSVIEKILNPLMFDVPSDDSIKEIVITKDAALGEAEPEIIRKKSTAKKALAQ